MDIGAKLIALSPGFTPNPSKRRSPNKNNAKAPENIGSKSVITGINIIKKGSTETARNKIRLMEH
jgi:hypothetical protein